MIYQYLINVYDSFIKGDLSESSFSFLKFIESLFCVSSAGTDVYCVFSFELWHLFGMYTITICLGNGSGNKANITWDSIGQ